MKQLATDPWDEIETHFKIGDMVKGKVSKITSYGAFVELDNDIDGLVHISQISEERVEKIKDVLNAGDEVDSTRYQDRQRRPSYRSLDQGRKLQRG